MNIPGSIQRELDAAREEGRLEGLREAIKHCEGKFDESISNARIAYYYGQIELRSAMYKQATMYMSIAGELKEKVERKAREKT